MKTPKLLRFKSRICLLPLILLIALTGYRCTSDNPNKVSQAISETYRVELDDTISMSKAESLAANWQHRINYPDCSKDTTYPYGYYVSPDDIDSLLKLGEEGGLRIYFAINDEDTMKLVLAGVDRYGKDAVDAKKYTGSYDFSSPCPSICDINSTIIQCPSLDSIALPKQNKKEVDLRDASRWTKNWRKKHGIPDSCQKSSSVFVKSYWISKEVFEWINKTADENSENGKGAMGIYFGSPDTTQDAPVYLILIPATLSENRPTDIKTRIYLASQVCPGDNCNCNSPLAKDSIQ